jgi:hypothetical protein
MPYVPVCPSSCVPAAVQQHTQSAIGGANGDATFMLSLVLLPAVRTTASTDEKTGTATTTSTVQAAAATTVEAGQKLARGLKGAGGKSGKFFSTLLKRGESGGGAAAAAAASNVAAASAATAMVVAGGGSAGGAAAQDHGPADLVQLVGGRKCNAG